MFQPSGGYGAGQNALIEDEARRAKAEALSAQVATGMSSGSLATSTGLRVGSDMTKAKLGVQDTRTQFLVDALSQLSGLRATRAGQVAGNADPYTNSYMGNLAQQNNNQLNYQMAEKQLQQQAYEAQAARNRQNLLDSRQWQADFMGSGNSQPAQPSRSTPAATSGPSGGWNSLQFGGDSGSSSYSIPTPTPKYVSQSLAEMEAYNNANQPKTDYFKYINDMSRGFTGL